jgi:hypothetical protein
VLAHCAHGKAELVGDDLVGVTQGGVGRDLSLARCEATGVENGNVVAMCDDETASVRIEVIDQRPAARDERLPESHGAVGIAASHRTARLVDRRDGAA